MRTDVERMKELFDMIGIVERGAGEEDRVPVTLPKMGGDLHKVSRPVAQPGEF